MKFIVFLALLGWSFSMFSQVATSPNREKLESHLLHLSIFSFGLHTIKVTNTYKRISNLIIKL